MRHWKMHSGTEICFSFIALLGSTVTEERQSEQPLDLRHSLSVTKGKAVDCPTVKSSTLSRETWLQHGAP